MAAQLRIVDAQLRAILGQDDIQSLVAAGRIPMAGDPPRPSLAGRVRLPGNRFRLEIEDRLALPRDESGSIDVPATTQLLSDVVERWVRADPGQWMWFHKRWEISGRPRSRRGQAKEAASR
jgi:hypothetical protein